MAEASSVELARLKALLDGALAGLEAVELKQLFGCDGYFVRGNIFAMVWKEGRLGLRLSDAEQHAELLACTGASPWVFGPKAVKHWVLLPKDWQRQPAKLRAWGRKAYALASERPEKSSVTRAPRRAKIRPAVFKKLKRRPG